jgi:hypothetical protein
MNLTKYGVWKQSKNHVPDGILEVNKDRSGRHS